MTTTINPTQSLNSTKSLKLKALIHDEVKKFLAKDDEIIDLVNALGSPLNVLFPCIVSENIKMFTDVFSRYSVSGRVFFAHKCNRSDSITRQLSVENASIDVSSIKELQHALGAGFKPDRIECTGPKSIELLGLCLQLGVFINVDSLWELEQLNQLTHSRWSDKPAKLLLRLAGFSSKHSRFLNKASRFGIAYSDLDSALDLLENNAHLDLRGFSFHLDTVSVLERTIAVENCIEAIERSVGRGFCPNILNLGGGYKVNYLESENDWNAYTSAIKEGVLGTAEPLAWHGNSFGLSAEKGTLRGNFNSYNYFDSTSGGAFLEELLNQRLLNAGEATVGAFLRDNMIEIWIEPGRSLVNQCGITLTKVNCVRSSSNGDSLINLCMKRQDISFLDQEIFVDPLLIKADSSKRNPIAAYLAGNLCLESDLVYRHKTFFDQSPKSGDVMVFANSAGYFMDFSATESIMQPIARRIAVAQNKWFMDDCYWPNKTEGIQG